MIKYVLCDLDDTIFDFHASEKESLRTALSCVSVTLNDEIYNMFKDINEKYFNLYASNKMDRISFHKERFRVLLENLKISCDPLKVNQIYIDTLKTSGLLFSDAEDTLEYLKNKNYDLYVVSNGIKEIQISRLKKAGIFNYFKDIFVSSEIGYNKPDSRFLDYVIKSIDDFDVTHYILIGDRPEADIKLANIYNMKSIYKGLGNFGTYNVQNLNEIKNIL